jgi:hypothetical protein
VSLPLRVSFCRLVTSNNMAGLSPVFHYICVGLDTPRVIVARPPSTNRSIPMCLLERGLMVGREEGLMSSFRRRRRRF